MDEQLLLLIQKTIWSPAHDSVLFLNKKQLRLISILYSSSMYVDELETNNLSKLYGTYTDSFSSMTYYFTGGYRTKYKTVPDSIELTNAMAESWNLLKTMPVQGFEL